MCGIVGYIGSQPCASILLDGLKRLEYRGYDSAGISMITPTGLRTVKAQGKLDHLYKAYYSDPFNGTVGLGHTRWATHGSPIERNAHPHQAGRVVIVHNGIIENFLELKNALIEDGVEFKSDTDTEVAAQLINQELVAQNDSLFDALGRALGRMEGSYALLALDTEDPDRLVVARNASPMVLGRGEGEAYAASDIPAVLQHTRDFVFMEDGDIAVLTREKTTIYDGSGKEVDREKVHIRWDPVSAEKQGYRHFMLKEIYEQPARIIDTLRGRAKIESGDVDLSEVKIDHEWLQHIDNITYLACGTSYYAALIGKYLIEDCARVPVQVALASEFRYSNPIITESTLVIPVSQSGETADTLAALTMAQNLGARALAVCNVIASTIARQSEGVLYTHAGPEIGVASTKAFTTQLVALSLLAIWLGRRRGTLSSSGATERLEWLRRVPTAVEDVLKDVSPYEELAKTFFSAGSFLFLGRNLQYPIALEGALKLKEISYIHAEGYAAGELKHGPIALIDDQMPVVVLAPQDHVYEKTLSNVEEIRARDGRVIGIVTKGDHALDRVCEFKIEIPEVSEFVQPIVTAVVVQLLAYHLADFLGTDIDQPRNLAKSVTVE